MDEIKSWLTSKTVWAGIVAIIAALLGHWGYTFSGQDQTDFQNTVVPLITGISGIVAIIGRVVASKRIG